MSHDITKFNTILEATKNLGNKKIAASVGGFGLVGLGVSMLGGVSSISRSIKKAPTVYTQQFGKPGMASSYQIQADPFASYRFLGRKNRF